MQAKSGRGRRRSSRYGAPALDKGLDILEALAVSRAARNRTDLARLLGRSPSEIFRMLDCLERRRYIERDAESGCYRLTLRLFELSHTHSPVERLLRVAQPALHRLAGQINESCHISILSGDSTLVVDRALSPAPVRLSVEVGLRLPALRTVSGRLLAAALPEAERRQLLDASVEFRKMTIRQRQSLQRSLEELRRLGYSLARSEYRLGVDAAVLIGNPEVGVSAALAVPFMAGGPNEGREQQRLPLLLGCAQEITAKLGLTPPPAN